MNTYRMMTRSLCSLALLSALGSGFTAPVYGEDKVEFNRDIRPLLTKHCTACHGGVKMAGDVSFVNRDTILPPDGWVIEPGDPDASILIERIESNDPDIRMPPPEHGKALPEEEVEILRAWIEQGATWQEHWAFEPPSPEPIPEVSLAQWPKKEIDYFVLARLEAEGIAPSPSESHLRWLRRVSFDLTGLPPTTAERSQFLEQVKIDEEVAYRTVVDRLLNSQAYGERWASVWLDQVRYADSRGLGADGPRNIWKYRDWVIDAFNHDMPYTEFTLKQIAGDLLPNATIDDRVATAVHRLTQSNEEGGTDDEEFRVAAVLDRVNTVWQTWQGVTFGCTQCHSHPYDPFKNEEFYQFASFFNNTRDCDLDDDWPKILAPLNKEDSSLANHLDNRIREVNDSIFQRELALTSNDNLWHPITSMQAKTNNATQVLVENKPSHAEYYTVDTVSRGTEFTLTVDIPPSVKQLTAIRFTGLPLDPTKALSDSEWGFVLSSFKAKLVQPAEDPSTDNEQALEFADVLIDEADPYYEPKDSLNPKTNRGFAAYSRINYPRNGAFVLKEPITVASHARLEVKLKFNVFILASFPIIAKRGHLAVSDSHKFTDMLTDEKLIALRKKLQQLKSRRSKVPSTSVPVLEERPARFARPSYTFVRGLFLTKGERVQPGTPASLPPMPDDQPVNRLGLAHWLINPQNPLTARVAVNRIWARLFGVGIVPTEEDFGTSGERPTHPQLLDFLALQFQNDYGYRFKPLLRDIVLSSTYRQSSVIRPELIERDAQNRLLARGPRHRLPAEMVRDQALAATGLLSSKMGGAPVRPPIPDGVWRPFAGWDKWNTPKQDDPDRYRRSIYTYTKRSIPYPMFASFDAPSREFCAPRRLRSNTPLQALMTLNDLTFEECAAALAKSLQAEDAELSQQISSGFIKLTCREPTSDELGHLIELYNSFGEEDKQSAMVSVARVLLNLDEVLTK